VQAEGEYLDKNHTRLQAKNTMKHLGPRRAVPDIVKQQRHETDPYMNAKGAPGTPRKKPRWTDEPLRLKEGVQRNRNKNTKRVWQSWPHRWKKDISAFSISTGGGPSKSRRTGRQPEPERTPGESEEAEKKNHLPKGGPGRPEGGPSRGAALLKRSTSKKYAQLISGNGKKS